MRSSLAKFLATRNDLNKFQQFITEYCQFILIITSITDQVLFFHNNVHNNILTIFHFHYLTTKIDY